MEHLTLGMGYRFTDLAPMPYLSAVKRFHQLHGVSGGAVNVPVDA